MSPPADTPLRIGLIGSGLMGSMHSAAYLQAGLLASDRPPFELVRVTSRNAETGPALAGRYGWRSSAQDWRDVTRADDVDVVDVCTPEDHHHEVVLDALAHGKHVLCEKPLATTSAAALEMWDAARAAGRVHVAGFVLRHWPALAHARALVDAGRIGALRTVRARYLIDSQTLLESSLRGLGSHVLDAAMYLAGPIAEVCAAQRPVHDAPEVDATVHALLRFRSGCTGVLEADREATGRKMDLTLELDGEAGGLSLRWSRREDVELVLAGGEAGLPGPRRLTVGVETSLPTVPFPGAGFGLADLFVVQAQALADEVAGTATPAADFGDGYRVAAVSDAVIGSVRGRGWVDVADRAQSG